MKIRSSHIIKEFIILFLVILPKSVISQEYQYIPFPDSNCIWSEVNVPPMGFGLYPEYYVLALFNEDTMINSIEYHKLYVLYDTIISKENAAYVGAIREDSTRKVYYKGESFHIFIPDSQLNENGELQLYDFSVDIGDTIHHAMFIRTGDFLVVSEIDTVEFLTGKRRVIHFEKYGWVRWIEGIGNDMGLLYSSGDRLTDGSGNALICFRINDTVSFLRKTSDDCFGYTTSVMEREKKSGPAVYPNPVTGNSKLEIPLSSVVLQIYNFNGSMIIRSHVKGMEYYTINSSRFNPGLYFFKILTTNDKIITGRFVVL